MSGLKTVSYEAISLASAQAAITAGIEAAAAMTIPMAIVIVDKAGITVASARMDGASPLTAEIAYKKAWTSAVTGAPTSGVHQFISTDPAALLCMPHATHFTTVGGGIPIQKDPMVIVGAVGVSGATAELDTKVAEAMIAALS